MIFEHSAKTKEYQARVSAFLEAHVFPRERDYEEHNLHVAYDWTKWTVPPFVEEIKAKAKAEGLWNMFMPPNPEHDDDEFHGAGLTNLEYAPLAELMGRHDWFSEVFNSSPPDTGNMEVLHRYGTPEQKAKWLRPLMAGEIRSAFLMTEPAVASSDATNIQCEIRREGDEYVINGRKWWSSGAGDKRCKIAIVMGKTDPSAETHKQQSQVLVPLDTPGVKIERILPVFGYTHAPHGHCEVSLTNVRVPVSNMILGEGRGFEIAQGRLGPGRIHHCMRLIGKAEYGLQRLCERIVQREPFGKPIYQQSVWEQRIAEARIEIEQCRLLTLKAAYMMDTVGNKEAKNEIAMIKVSAPRMACKVLDDAIQAWGGGGMTTDAGLADLWAWSRALRLADGPDEVHCRSIARNELRPYLKKA